MLSLKSLTTFLTAVGYLLGAVAAMPAQQLHYEIEFIGSASPNLPDDSNAAGINNLGVIAGHRRQYTRHLWVGKNAAVRVPKPFNGMRSSMALICILGIWLPVWQRASITRALLPATMTINLATRWRSGVGFSGIRKGITPPR
ncbi:MAG: hypothetical protein H8E15_09290 [Planctomycetes bacterium]|nr:hypothetical protein [Planctomycetota bacterium]